MTEINKKIYNSVCPRDCYGVCSLTITTENDQIVKIAGNKNNKNSEGFICPKGASYKKRLYHPSRLKAPLLKNKASGEFDPITWDEAFDLLAENLNKYRDESEAVMYLSGWGHAGVFNNYAKNFWSEYGVVSTTYGSLCMAGASAAVRATYGNTIKHNHNRELEHAKLIIVWGANPANTNIHRMRSIKRAVKSGSQLIVIDPRVSETMIEGSLRVHPQGGTDALLAMGIAKLLIEKNLCDNAFIEQYVLGFEAYKEYLKTVTLEEIAERTQVSLETIHQIVAAIEANPIFALVSGTGKSRYTNAGQTERAVCILPALMGTLQHRGGGLYFADNQHPKLKWPYEIKNPMRGKIHVGSIAEELTEQSPAIKMLWIEKANPLTSSPNIDLLSQAFKQLEFIVVVEHFMSDTAKAADLILPAAMLTEKNDLLVVYGDSYLHLLQKVVEPYKACKSEPEIYRLLGERLGFDMENLPIVDKETIDNLLEFNQIKTSYDLLSEQPYLKEDYKTIAYEALVFDTPSGKIELYSDSLMKYNDLPLPTYVPLYESKERTPELVEKYPLHFLTSHASGRINSQFTEMNLSKEAHPIVDLHPEDAKTRGIKTGDLVTIFNDRGQINVRCEVGEKIKKGTVHIYEGWGEDYKASVNKLSYGRKTDLGDGTAFHDCYVEVKVSNEGKIL